MNLNIEQITAIGFIFEKENGNALGELELAWIEESDLADVSPELLKKELITRVSFPTKAFSAYRCAAYSAIGKTFDKELRNWYVSQLKHELKYDVESLYMILIALDNIEETVFDDDRNGSTSTFDYDLNIRDAMNYLKSQPVEGGQ